MTLYYELEELETLIYERFHPNHFVQHSALEKDAFKKLEEVLSTETTTVKKRLKSVTYGFSKEHHRRLYIRQNQSGIVKLKNALVDYLAPKDANDLHEKPSDNFERLIYKRSLEVLGELFSFIRHEFPQYFDCDEQVPFATLLLIHKKAVLQISALKQQLTNSAHESVLVDLVLKTISYYYDPEGKKNTTYRELTYMKTFMSEITALKEEDLNGTTYPLLIKFLVYINFNNIAFKNYLVQLTREQLEKCNNLTERIELISFHLKEMSQIPIKPNTALITTANSVQSEIENWLFNEMSHLEKKQSLSVAVSPSAKFSPERDNPEKGIYSVMTVEELGLFLRIQKDTNLLKNKNMKQVAQTVATNWHTKQKESISWQYLYNSMSTIEVNTIRNLEDKLVGMVNQLRKMRRQ